MITPNGKHRTQVNQGGLRHSSIWESDWFEEAAGLAKEAIAATPVSPEIADDTPQPDGDLQSAMLDGNSSRMNPGRIPSDGEMKGKPGVPPDARFDPYTGDPLMGVNGTKLVQMLEQWLGSNQQTADLSIVGFNEKGGQYTITFGPKGKAVTKGV
jgi:hypothetical protein